MSTKLIRDYGLAATLFVAGFSLCGAAEKAAVPEKAKPKPAPTASAEVQKFSERRDSLLAAREALEKELKGATEARRKEIEDKMEAQRKELLDMQRSVARQIREDARKRLNDAAAATKQ